MAEEQTERTFTNDLEAFKAEYEALCLKHGYYIAACGCCNSPWILDWHDKGYHGVPNVDFQVTPIEHDEAHPLPEFKM